MRLSSPLVVAVALSGCAADVGGETDWIYDGGMMDADVIDASTQMDAALPDASWPQGGPGDVEGWRPLVEHYFSPDQVENALAVMTCESRGDPNALNSSSGASGLFQFIERTWTWCSEEAGFAGETPFNPEANIASAAFLVEYSIRTDHPRGAWGHWSCQP